MADELRGKKGILKQPRIWERRRAKAKKNKGDRGTDALDKEKNGKKSL